MIAPSPSLTATEASSEYDSTSDSCSFVSSMGSNSEFTFENETSLNDRYTIKYTKDFKPMKSYNSEVFLASCQDTGTIVVVKLLQTGFPFATELALLKLLKGQKGFAQLVDHFQLNEIHKFLVFQYLDHPWKNLQYFLANLNDKNILLPEQNKKLILVNVYKTLMQLLDMGYYHCDIKAENIMVHSETMEIVLIDFGSARPLSKHLQTQLIGSAFAFAPEMRQLGQYYFSKSEAYAFGVLAFVVIFNGFNPFLYYEQDAIDTNAKVQKTIRDMEACGYQIGQIELSTRQFVYSLLEECSEKRIDFDHIQECEYMKFNDDPAISATTLFAELECCIEKELSTSIVELDTSIKEEVSELQDSIQEELGSIIRPICQEPVEVQVSEDNEVQCQELQVEGVQDSLGSNATDHISPTITAQDRFHMTIESIKQKWRHFTRRFNCCSYRE
ncbi:hypothetical protein HDV02_004589 [Globomyces sp. JEL0801]|nr:hypothetical protein HDV02_004589 [Globomyces sp. JEL0801]